jgi:hypothetical protein
MFQWIIQPMSHVMSAPIREYMKALTNQSVHHAWINK